jgi:hypothetical protein
LALFGRRLSQRGDGLGMPAFENLHIFGLTSKAYLYSIISSAMESTPGRHLDEFIISTRIYYRPRCLMPKSALHSRGLFRQYRSIADLPPSIP